MNPIMRNFIFDSDVVILSSYNSEEDIYMPASNSEYKLRSYGTVIFNSNEKGIPLIEISHKLRESRTDDASDPLLSIVLGDVEGKFISKLYFCINDGSDYIELASYLDLFEIDYRQCYAGLEEYKDGAECSIETMNTLKLLLSKAILYIQDKVDYMKKQ